MPEFTSYPSGTPSWIDIQTPDVAATTAFYGGLFGWESEDMGPDAGGYCLFTKDGKQVAGVGPQMMAGAPVMWLTYIATDDIGASVTKAAESGATVFMGPMDVMTAGKMAVLADPAGAPFALWEAGDHKGAQLANESGTFVWNELDARDLDGSTAFYTGLFGWGAKTEDFGGMPYTQWMLGDHEVGGMTGMPPMVPAEVQAYWIVYFGTDDADGSVAKATELGGTTLMPPTDTPVGRLAIVQDPHGAAFALIQSPAS